MKIVELHAENVKRLRAVTIQPDGSLVVIGGKNDEGKTSVLDSIAYALGGKALMCGQPLRKGAAKGTARVDLGDLVVSRTFTKGGGGSLKVESRQEGVLKSPQAILDKLVGSLTFDPLAFSRMSPKDQAETLRAVVGISFDTLDQRRADLYDKRAEANRMVAQSKARFAEMTFHDDAPVEEVSVAALVVELQMANEAAVLVNQLQNRVLDTQQAAARAEQRQAEIKGRMRDLAAELLNLERESEAVADAVQAHYIEAERLDQELSERIDALPKASEIQAQITSASQVNEKVRANRSYREQEAVIEAHVQEANKLTQALSKIIAEKARLISEARFPVEGLGFDESGVTMNGLPFDQASSAQQLRVSVGMGFAMNPELKVLLIREGSLLDEENLALVAQLAEEADGQVWIERVGVDGNTSVIIDDGMVFGEEEPPCEESSSP